MLQINRMVSKFTCSSQIIMQITNISLLCINVFINVP